MLHQQTGTEMMRQPQGTIAIASICYQGNANTNAIFGQQVRKSAGLAFTNASISIIHMVVDGDDVLSKHCASPRG
jgi:hypothetical protein